MSPSARAGLFYEDGRFVRTLAPGRYSLWSLPWGRQEIVPVDMRRTQMALSVRLNVVAEYRVFDAPRATHTVVNYATALYAAVQVLLSDEVQARTLDTLLADRSALTDVLLARTRPEAETLGLEMLSVGVRDIILPGDVKRMLAQEAEALRTGRAALVAAREETAATRANTARLLADSPVLLRLREIEALAEVGKGMGNTVVLAIPNDLMAVLKKE